MRQRDLKQRVGLVGRERNGRVALSRTTQDRAAPAVVGECRHVVTAQDVVDERDVFGRDELADVVEGVAPLIGTRVLGRHDEIDAERPTSDLVLDPGEIDLELLGRMGHGAEHTHPARFGHRGDDIATVREGEDRNVDAEHLGNGGLHGNVGLLRVPRAYGESTPCCHSAGSQIAGTERGVAVATVTERSDDAGCRSRDAPQPTGTSCSTQWLRTCSLTSRHDARVIMW